MSLEAVLKGQIAESIIRLLFEENGYKVICVAREGLLMGVDRDILAGAGAKNPSLLNKLTTVPPLLVVNRKSKEIYLLRVRFSGKGTSGRNIVYGSSQLRKYWPEARLVIVTNHPPYFSSINGNGRQVPLSASFPGINKKSLSRFGGLAKGFLRR